MWFKWRVSNWREMKLIADGCKNKKGKINVAKDESEFVMKMSHLKVKRGMKINLMAQRKFCNCFKFDFVALNGSCKCVEIEFLNEIVIKFLLWLKWISISEKFKFLFNFNILTVKINLNSFCINFSTFHFIFPKHKPECKSMTSTQSNVRRQPK